MSFGQNSPREIEFGFIVQRCIAWSPNRAAFVVDYGSCYTQTLYYLTQPMGISAIDHHTSQFLSSQSQTDPESLQNMEQTKSLIQLLFQFTIVFYDLSLHGDGRARDCDF